MTRTADINEQAAHHHRIPVADSQTVRQSIRPLVGPDLSALLVASAILVVATGIGLLGPIVLGRIVDFTTRGESHSLTAHALWFLAVVLIGSGLTGFGQVKLSQVGEAILERLRTGLLGQAFQVPLTRLEKAGVGDLVSRMTSDINTLTRVIRYALPECALAVLELSLLFIALLLVSPWFGLALLVGLGPVIVGGRWYLRHAPPRYDEERRRVGTQTDRIQEYASGWRTLRAFGFGPLAQALIQDSADGVYDAVMAATRARNVLRPSVIAGQSLAMLTTLLIGTWLLQHQALSLGLVTAAALYQLRLTGPILTLLELLDELQSATASYRRVLGVQHIAQPSASSSAVPNNTGVELDGVHFSFESGGDEILNDIQLTIAPGEHLAIVGPSGAGKTTLGKLIAGRIKPTRGTIRLGGLPLGDLGETLAQRIVLLTQETHLFSGPLADDLRLAQPLATDEHLWRVLDQVGAESWVSALPSGLNEPVGAGHRQLTPAQEQQIALARLLLLDPDVVVLDEAMAALGPRLSGQMENRLENVLQQRTVISITHRLETAARADRIVVIVGGQLREWGTHQELMASAGLYSGLWQQRSGDGQHSLVSANPTIA